MHDAVGEHEHDVRRAGAALFPGVELDRREVGDEVRLPDVVPGTDQCEVAVAGVVLVLAGAVVEREVVCRR